MWNIYVCDGDEEERAALAGSIRRCCDGKGLRARIEGCADWPGLSGKVKGAEPDLVVVALDGVEGLDAITSLGLIDGKTVWFSDLDFGVQAYRLCVSYFARKPVTDRKMERALAPFLEAARRAEEQVGGKTGMGGAEKAGGG